MEHFGLGELTITCRNEIDRDGRSIQRWQGDGRIVRRPEGQALKDVIDECVFPPPKIGFRRLKFRRSCDEFYTSRPRVLMSAVDVALSGSGGSPEQSADLPFIVVEP